MNHSPPPPAPAPGGMGGSQRMFDPSEAAHDRVRRRLMNVAFVALTLGLAGQAWWIGMSGRDWLAAALLVVAGAPLALAASVFELRFKLAREERRAALRQLPSACQWRWVAYAALLLLTALAHAPLLGWALLGMWGCDFVRYYHDRPERMRHLYAALLTLDELRDFPAPWAWPLPALCATALL